MSWYVLALPWLAHEKYLTRKFQFITISAVVGAGIYTRPGLMLRVGGPGAVIVAFAILGFLAWTVSVSIAEMVLIWPVSNALVLFVRNFVDDELGTVVGIAYWYRRYPYPLHVCSAHTLLTMAQVLLGSHLPSRDGRCGVASDLMES